MGILTGVKKDKTGNKNLLIKSVGQFLFSLLLFVIFWNVYSSPATVSVPRGLAKPMTLTKSVYVVGQKIYQASEQFLIVRANVCWTNIHVTAV